MKQYLVGTNEISHYANISLAETINGLRSEGYLTQEQGDEIARKYTMVCVEKRTLLKALKNKLFGEGSKEDDIRVIFTKVFN